MNLTPRAQVYRTRKAARVQRRLRMMRPYVGEHGPEVVSFTESGAQLASSMRHWARLLFTPTDAEVAAMPSIAPTTSVNGCKLWLVWPTADGSRWIEVARENGVSVTPYPAPKEQQ